MHSWGGSGIGRFCLAGAMVAAACAGCAEGDDAQRNDRSGAGAASLSGGVATYIVRLSDPPAVAYDGTIPGHPATRPARGRKIDPTAAAVVGYTARLSARHDAALAAVGGATKLYSYAYSLYGFAARLTARQAAELGRKAGVVSVTKDELLKIATSRTPSFLGLDASGGLWSQLGGSAMAGDGRLARRLGGSLGALQRSRARDPLPRRAGLLRRHVPLSGGHHRECHDAVARSPGHCRCSSRA